MMNASCWPQSTSPINWYRSPSWNGKGEILEQSTDSMAELFLGSCIQTKFSLGSYLNNLPNVRIMTPCKPGATCRKISETGINLAGAAITGLVPKSLLRPRSQTSSSRTGVGNETSHLKLNPYDPELIRAQSINSRKMVKETKYYGEFGELGIIQTQWANTNHEREGKEAVANCFDRVWLKK